MNYAKIILGKLTHKIGGLMSQVFISCPKTEKPVYVGLNMEWGQLEALDMASVDQRIKKCPHCGQEHWFKKNDLFLRADGGGRGRFF